MNAEVGKQNGLATSNITINIHRRLQHSFSSMSPHQAFRLLPPVQTYCAGRFSSSLSTAEEQGRDAKAPTALLVIDQSHALELYGNYLRNRGYNTVMCASPGQGLNSLEAESVSVVIVSQDSPEFEGRVILERSVRLHPKVPVLVVARVLDIHCYLDAMDLGAADYLESPEPQDLAWVIDTQIHRFAVS